MDRAMPPVCPRTNRVGIIDDENALQTPGETTSLQPLTLHPPRLDPSPIFEVFRGNYGTELLTAAIADFKVFGKLAAGPLAGDALRRELGLAERPAVVLLTALRAFGLLTVDTQGRFDLTDLAREHLVPGGMFDVSSYVGLTADHPGVRETVERLRTNQPASGKVDQPGAAFIYRQGLESAMEKEASARRLTLALAGRAVNVAPVLAQRLPLPDARQLLDVGGGTGIYSIAWLQQHPRLRALVWDRPEVLKVAMEMAVTYGVADRLQCVPGDMFHDPVPPGSDAILAQPVSDTDVLLRLQNNLKLRALERGDGARGRDVAGRMVLLAPRRPDLWFDLARINEAMGILGEARNAYERCSGLARPGEALHNEAALALANLRRRLN